MSWLNLVPLFYWKPLLLVTLFLTKLLDAWTLTRSCETETVFLLSFELSCLFSLVTFTPLFFSWLSWSSEPDFCDNSNIFSARRSFLDCSASFALVFISRSFTCASFSSFFCLAYSNLSFSICIIRSTIVSKSVSYSSNWFSRSSIICRAFWSSSSVL